MTGIVLIPLYLTVRLLLADNSRPRFSRFAIMASYALSLLVPAVITMIGHSTPNIEIELLTPTAYTIDNTGNDASKPDFAKIASLTIIAVYFTGLFLFIIREVISWLRLRPILNGSDRMDLGSGRILILHKHDDVAPFSWNRYVVMSHSDYENDGRLIMLHEFKHLDSMHWLDLLFAELVSLFVWYNPAGWLMKDELQTVHEYEADDAVLKSGTNVQEYQLLIIKKAVGGRLPSITNSLKQSNLSKRIKMMLRKDSSKRRHWRAIAVVPAVAIGAIVLNLDVVAKGISHLSDVKVTNYSPNMQADNTLEITYESSSKNNPMIIIDGETYKGDINNISPDKIASITVLKDSTATAMYGSEAKDGVIIISSKSGNGDAGATGAGEKLSEVKVVGVSTVKKDDRSNQNIYSAVEENPRFPGGEMAMMQYLAKNIKYPEEAMKTGAQGRVIVKFVVSSTGKISDITIERGVSPELDAEAIRVVGGMPDFTPGKIDGKPVSVWYVLPVSFKLQ